MAIVDVSPSSGELRAARKAAGVSQQRIAELAGCSMSMVKLLEAGYRPETSDVLERIGRVLVALEILKTSRGPADEPDLDTNPAEQGRYGRV